MTLAAWIAQAPPRWCALALPPDGSRQVRGALLSGVILDRKLALEIVGSTGLVTVMCMFLIASALEHTGSVDEAVRRLLRLARTRPTTAWALFFALVLVGSMVIPNTPVVALACPAALLLAQRTRTASTRVLLPIAYLATLGGSVTVIGSSVNVVASNLLQEHGGNGFTIATLAPIALPVAGAGALSLWLLARWLPAGPVSTSLRYNPEQTYAFELIVRADDDLVDQPLAQTLLLDPGIEIREFIPFQPGVAASSNPGIAGFRPKVGDRLLVRAKAAQLLTRLPALPAPDDATVVLDAWVPAYSRLAGLRVDQLRLESILPGSIR